MCLFRCQTEVHRDATHKHTCPYSLQLITHLIKNSTFVQIPKKWVLTEPSIVVFNSFEGKQLRFCFLSTLGLKKKNRFSCVMVNWSSVSVKMYLLFISGLAHVCWNKSTLPGLNESKWNSCCKMENYNFFLALNVKVAL